MQVDSLRNNVFADIRREQGLDEETSIWSVLPDDAEHSSDGLIAAHNYAAEMTRFRPDCCHMFGGQRLAGGFESHRLRRPAWDQAVARYCFPASPPTRRQS